MLLLLLLQAVGDDVIRAGLDRLGSADLEVRQAAEAALAALGEEAIPAIERLAAGADPEIRGRAADVVRRLRWWDHVVYWRGRKIDVRHGLAQSSGFDPRAAALGKRILDVSADAVRAVDVLSGKALWTSTPDLEKGGDAYWRLEPGESSVLLRTLGALLCYDAESGRLLWTRKGRWSQVAALPGGDWIVGEGRTVERRGSTSWAVELPATFPLAAAGSWVFVGDDKSTRVLDAATGRELRKLDGMKVYGAAEAGEGRVLVVEAGSLTALRMSDGTRLWTRPNVQEATRLLVEGARVYVADHMSMCCSIQLYALEVESGAPLWKAPAQGIPTSHSKYRHQARLARVGPHLVLLGEAAAGDYVETFDPATGALVSRWTSQ